MRLYQGGIHFANVHLKTKSMCISVFYRFGGFAVVDDVVIVVLLLLFLLLLFLLLLFLFCYLCVCSCVCLFVT